MTCFSAKRQMTPYVDGVLKMRERRRIDEHLSECDRCAAQFDQISSLRMGLRSLAPAAIPENLSMKLRVLASREKQALIETHGSRLTRLWEAWKFRLDDLMRPLTIPATGGLLSSMLLFVCLAFAIAGSTHSVGYEVPVIYHERTDANLLPMSVRTALLLNISLDGDGRIQDYHAHDAREAYEGDPAHLVSNSMELPDYPSRAISGDISILVTPLVFRQ